MPALNLNSSDTTYTNIESDDEVQTFVAENGNRVGLMIFNASTSVLYLQIDDDATTDDYIIKLVAGALYEMPRGYFTDKVTGIWATANGYAKVIEISTRTRQSI